MAWCLEDSGKRQSSQPGLHTGTVVEGRDRQWIPELCFGIDVQEEEGDRSPWSWDGKLQGSGGAGLGVEGRGTVRGAPSIAPTPGMQEGGWAAGPGPRAVPTVSVSCTSRQHPQRARSLSPPTWRSCSGRCFPRYPCRRHRPSKFSLCLWRQVDTVS